MFFGGLFIVLLVMLLALAVFTYKDGAFPSKKNPPRDPIITGFFIIIVSLCAIGIGLITALMVHYG